MKRLLTILSAAAIGTGAMAQGEGLKFGAKAGLNITNTPNTQIGWICSSKIGAHAGGMMNYGLGRNGNFSILAELLFDMKGSKVQTINAQGATEDVPFSLTYLTIPIQARYRFNFGLYAETGPYLGLLLGASLDGDSEYVYDVDDDGNDLKRKVKEDLKGTDFGWAWGVGYINEAGWGVGYRGSFGFNIADPVVDPDNTFFESYVMINTATQLSFLYYFGWDD